MGHSDGELEEPDELLDQEVVVAEREVQAMPTDFIGENMNLSRLTRLCVRGASLSDLPVSLGLLTNLSCLDLTDNKLKDLPDELRLLRVNRLTVAGNQLTSLPSCFYLGLSDVRELDISRNNISSLVTPPLCAAKLQCLDFSDNRVPTLPEWLSTSCGALSSLSAARNETLRGMAGGAVLRMPLRRLDLTACRVGELDFLAILRGIEVLHLGNGVTIGARIGNQFWEFPQVILQSAETLYELSLRGTGLTWLLPGIGALHSLALLDLRDCDLHTLPTELGHLSSLHTLLLSRNDLISLPDSICGLRSLRQLHLDGNQMELLPETMSRLSGLVLLDLYDNRLDQWESGWLDTLTSLQAFDLERNHCPAEDSERYVELRRCLRLRLNANHRLVGDKPRETTLSEDEDSDGVQSVYSNFSNGYKSDEDKQTEQQKSGSDWGCNDENDISDDEWSPPDTWTIVSRNTGNMIWPPPKTLVLPNCVVSEGQFTDLAEN